MLRRFGVLLIFLGSLIPSVGQAGIDLSGAIRNDTVLLAQGSDTLFFDILESQLVLQRKTNDWRFYSDLRVFLYAGDIQEIGPEIVEGVDFITLRILRGFIRYYTEYGDFTLGKTYINLGIPSVFNPFELDRDVNVTDLSYTKEGILALTYEVPFAPLSGGKFYVSPEADQSEVSAGMDLYTNLGSFDLGLVAARTGRDQNLAGVYFKGDAEVELQGACALRADDEFSKYRFEAMVGADYSFFEGEWLLGAQFYYNGNENEEAQGNTTNGFAQLGYASFSDRYYIYANLLYAPDGFFQFRLDGFVNLEDYSALVVHTLSWVLADGLNLSLQWMIPTGVGDTQYSREVIGKYVILARVEAKL